MREIILLACSECKRKNYSTNKNKRNTPDKLQLEKYCRFCRKHTMHKETKAYGQSKCKEQKSQCRITVITFAFFILHSALFAGTQASSSNGRAPDSKSGCWGVESLLACHSRA